MNDLRLHCPSCNHESPLPPEKCPHCGAFMTVRTHRQSLNPVAVLVLLFLVLGPFGFGMLWRNDRFTRPAKWALTVIVLVYTALVLWACYVAVQHTMAAFDKAMNQVNF